MTSSKFQKMGGVVAPLASILAFSSPAKINQFLLRTITMGCLASGVMLASGVEAKALIISFDSLPGNTVITNQFPEATFTSNAGFQVRTIVFSASGSSSPNVIAAYTTSGTSSFNQNIFVNFAQAVNNLSFKIVGDNSTIPGLVDIFTSAGLAGTVNIVADGNISTADTVNSLLSFTDITSISINSVTDPGGIGYDDFSFDIAPATAVPFEFSHQASLVLLGGAWLVRRGLKKRSAEKMLAKSVNS